MRFDRSNVSWRRCAPAALLAACSFIAGNALAATPQSLALRSAAATVPVRAFGIDGAEPWTQRAKLIAPDGAIDDYLGRSVAIDGDTAVVGAGGSDVDGNGNQGSAYVFVRSGDTWTEQAKLTSSDGASGDEFGFAVAISGDTIVIGSRFSLVNGVNGSGAAYVYTRSGTQWTEQAKLSAEDAAPFDELGFSVAVDADTALVGAPFANNSQGKVYAFTRSGTTWTAQTTLAAADGGASDRFGLAVSLAGDSAIVGSPSADIAGNSDQGAAYVFVRTGSVWDFQAKLAGDDSAPFDEFGNAVSIDGDTVVVGAHVMNIGSNGNQGAAYAFFRSGGVWTQQAKLVADDGSFTDEFGFSVAVSGDTAVVGALFANPDGHDNQGEAYVFARTDATWSQQARLVSDGVAGDEFGIGIDISGDTAVVGAEFGATDGEWRGAAYVFSSRAPAALAEITPQSLSFALAPETSSSSPLDIANVGDAGSSLAFSIDESAGVDCSAPADVPWLDVSPATGDVSAGSSQPVIVTADATGLGAGDYSAVLCVTTSDLSQALVPVSVTLTVSGSDPDVIFVDGFDSP